MDEFHLEYAAAHRPSDAPTLQSEILTPYDFAVLAEEGEDFASARADAQEIFLSYCFADARPEEWRLVACRAHAAISTMWPSLIARRTHHELLAIRAGMIPRPGFPLAELIGRIEDLEMVETMETVIAYYFPDGPRWLENGTQHLYLLARVYQGGLVTRWKDELTFEALAGVFGELPLAPEGSARSWAPPGWTAEDWTRARDRARSRWSARFAGLITRKIEAGGSKRPAMLGKSASVAKKYAQAARGNQNRRQNADVDARIPAPQMPESKTD